MQVNGDSQIAKEEWTYSGLFTMMSVIQCIWTDLDSALENVKTAYDLCKNEKNIAQRIKVLLAEKLIKDGELCLMIAGKSFFYQVFNKQHSELAVAKKQLISD